MLRSTLRTLMETWALRMSVIGGSSYSLSRMCREDRLVRYICQGECESAASLVDGIGVVASVNTHCTRCRVEIADPFLLFCGRLEKTADRVEDDLELSVVKLFEFVDAFGEIRVLGNDLPEVNKCTDDLDVYA